MRVKWSLKNDKITEDSGGGVIGQISFRRLAEQLRAAGEIKPRETITEFAFDFGTGLIQYTVESVPAREGQ